MAQLSTSKPNDLGVLRMPFPATRQLTKTAGIFRAADRMVCAVADGDKVLYVTAGGGGVSADQFGTCPADDLLAGIQLLPSRIIENSGIDCDFGTLGSVLKSTQ